MPSSNSKRIDTAALSHDLGLVTRLRTGDPTALEEVMEVYWRPIVLYAARLMGDDLDAAQDVAQEACVRLWERRPDLKPGSIKSYLYRIARNLALDELRKRQVRKRWQAETKELGESSTLTPAQITEQKEFHRAVDCAIRSLPLRRREVFVLAYLHGLSYQTIADVMGISPATVKNQMAAALAALRANLKSYVAS